MKSKIKLRKTIMTCDMTSLRLEDSLTQIFDMPYH